MKHLLGVAVAFCLLGTIIAYNTGFRAAITGNGFNYIDKVGLPILKKIIWHTKVQNQSGRSDGFDYKFYGFQMKEIIIDDSQIKASTAGVLIQGSNMIIKIKVHWHIRQHDWPHITEVGSVDVKLYGGMKLNTIVNVVRNDHGEPVVKPVHCSLSIPQIDTQFHGDVKWMLDLLKSTIESYLRDKIKEETCKNVFTEVVTDVTHALKSLPVSIKLPGDKFELSYELTKPPHFEDSNLIWTEHRGEFLMVANPFADAPFLPPPLPEISSNTTDKMLYLWITDHVANTAGYIFQKGDALKYNIKPDIVPKDFPLQLNTSSFKFIIPALYKQFPNMEMEVYVNSTKAPWVTATRNNVNMTVTGTLDINVKLPNGTRVNGLVLGVSVDANAFVWIKNPNKKPVISANCTADKTSFKLSLVSSNIGEINVSLLGDATNLFIEGFLLPVLNKYGNAGIILPVVDGLSLVDPQITIYEGYVLIGTDFLYKKT